MKRKTKIFIGLGIVLGATAFLTIRRIRNKKEIQKINDILDAKIKDPNTNVGGQKIIEKSAYDALPDGVFPIAFGGKGKKVYDVQRFLNSKFGTTLDLDGVYGDSTFEALCSKVWNTGLLTAKYIDCYDTNLSGVSRRKITQQDYDNLKI